MLKTKHKNIKKFPKSGNYQAIVNIKKQRLKRTFNTLKEAIAWRDSPYKQSADNNEQSIYFEQLGKSIYCPCCNRAMNNKYYLSNRKELIQLMFEQLCGILHEESI